MLLHYSVLFQCTQASYHLFHCQLDIRWLHLTLLYQLISYKQRFKSDSEESQCYRKEELTFETLDNNLLLVTSDLITIALKRFNTIQLNDLCTRSMFTCTCVREFWKLLQISADKLHEKGECMVIRLQNHVTFGNTAWPRSFYSLSGCSSIVYAKMCSVIIPQNLWPRTVRY